MKDRALTRFAHALPVRLATAVLVCLCTLCAVADPGRASFPARQQQEPAPIERRAPMPHAAQQNGDAVRRGPRGEHLAEWMNHHNNLTLQQQQQALEREPGFHDLPQSTQQRMRDRLAQLDAMNPQRRQRLLARNEALERLTPDQRADVRGALQQLGSLPPEQRRTVAHTFRQLRDLPPEQRISAYGSGRFGAPLNEEQRTVLFHLLRVEPMLPPPGPGPADQPMH